MLHCSVTDWLSMWHNSCTVKTQQMNSTSSRILPSLHSILKCGQRNPLSSTAGLNPKCWMMFYDVGWPGWPTNPTVLFTAQWTKETLDHLREKPNAVQHHQRSLKNATCFTQHFWVMLDSLAWALTVKKWYWGTNFFVRKEAPYHGPGSYFTLIFSASLNLWPEQNR